MYRVSMTLFCLNHNLVYLLYFCPSLLISRINKLKQGCGLGTHLFVKVPRPGDSEVTFSLFESSCHLLLPV